jgi:5-methylcytosine-specific restriction endonuclease McrA
MGYSDETLWEIFHNNGGVCYHCNRVLIFEYYGDSDVFGGWCVDHGTQSSRGGIDDLRNWRPSCYQCNEEKSDQTTDEYGRRQRRPPFLKYKL